MAYLYELDILNRVAAGHTLLTATVNGRDVWELKDGGGAVVLRTRRTAGNEEIDLKRMRSNLDVADEVPPELTQAEIETITIAKDGTQVWNLDHNRIETYRDGKCTMLVGSTVYFDDDATITTNGIRCGVDTSDDEVTLTINEDEVTCFFVFDAYKKFNNNSCFVVIDTTTYELDVKEKMYEFSYNSAKSEWKHYETGMKVKS